MSYENSVGLGWQPLVKTLVTYCERKDKNIPIEQIKQKFGGLRFYIGPTDDPEIHTMIKFAEWVAEITCEECGKEGKIRSNGWRKCLCDEHAK